MRMVQIGHMHMAIIRRSMIRMTVMRMMVMMRIMVMIMMRVVVGVIVFAYFTFLLRWTAGAALEIRSRLRRDRRLGGLLLTLPPLLRLLRRKSSRIAAHRGGHARIAAHRGGHARIAAHRRGHARIAAHHAGITWHRSGCVRRGVDRRCSGWNGLRVSSDRPHSERQQNAPSQFHVRVYCFIHAYPLLVANRIPPENSNMRNDRLFKGASSNIVVVMRLTFRNKLR